MRLDTLAMLSQALTSWCGLSFGSVVIHYASVQTTNALAAADVAHDNGKGTSGTHLCITAGWLATGGLTESSYSDELMDMFTTYFASKVASNAVSAADGAVRYTLCNALGTLVLPRDFLA